MWGSGDEWNGDGESDAKWRFACVPPDGLRDDGGGSEPADESDHLSEDAEVRAAGLDDDRLHRRMLWPQHDGVALAGEALDGRLAVDERGDHVAGLRRVLPPHEDEVAIHDVGVDHA